ncbi:hypothetical protein BJV74DRAFT_403089 [Russula compacta]|nr:hypothetical protein BJV74DRAFT_403089 [Russula compacta]
MTCRARHSTPQTRIESDQSSVYNSSPFLRYKKPALFSSGGAGIALVPSSSLPTSSLSSSPGGPTWEGGVTPISSERASVPLMLSSNRSRTACPAAHADASFRRAFISDFTRTAPRAFRCSSTPLFLPLLKRMFCRRPTMRCAILDQFLPTTDIPDSRYRSAYTSPSVATFVYPFK